MKNEDLKLWAEDQCILRRLALETLLEGRTTFISPFTGTRKSVLDLLNLKRIDNLGCLKGCFLPDGYCDFLPYMTRDQVIGKLATSKHVDRDFPSYFVLSGGDELEVFKIGGPGNLTRVFKKKIKRK